MRTKNAKRLWPVPVTLAVMALAAFLAFGLMATNGAQPAAAQAADCTVTVAAGNGDDGVSIGADVNCDAYGDTATIKFVGPSGRPGADAQPIPVYVLIEDEDGSEDIYPAGTYYQAENNAGGTRDRGSFYENVSSATDEVEPTAYSSQNVSVPRAAQEGGRYVAQSTTITVGGEGTVRVYLPDQFGAAGVVEDVNCANSGGSDCVEGTDPSPPDDALMFISGAPANDTATVNIRFLGVPALGEDKDTDFNDDLDDEEMEQCVLTGDADDEDAELVGEAATNGCNTHEDKPDNETWVASDEITDVPESRSKLVVRTGVEEATSGDSNPLIDGGELTHTMADEDAVTIYAVVKDAKNQPLEDIEVSFSSTTNPSGIIAARDLADEGDAEAAGSTLAGNLDGVEDTDAIVAYELNGLSDVEGPYLITVEVMAGELDLGTVIITRPDAPERIVAGVFNAACFMPGGEDKDDYELATFNAKNKGCDSSGMARRFGAGEMIVVKAHLEDSLDNVVGMSNQLKSKLADKDDDLLGDADIVIIDTPVKDKTMPRAWIYTVGEDATLGDHMIEVSTTAKDKDRNAISSEMLTVTVAGAPHEIELGGADNIPLNGSQTFTITATDMLDGVPHFGAKDDDNKVTISVQPTDALVVGVDASNQVTLDEDTGMAEFTVYASLDADDGDAGRIIAGSGDLQDILPITFGMMDDETGMPMMTKATGIIGSYLPAAKTFGVTWTPAADAEQQYIVLFSLPDYEVLAGGVKVLGPDASSNEFTFDDGLAAGDYEVLVATFIDGTFYYDDDTAVMVIVE